MSEEIDLYSETHPLSLFSLLHSNRELIAAIKALPAHLVGAPERELRRGFKPDAMLERLKISFWDEYRRAQNAKTHMVMANVVYGLCSKPYFYEKIMRDRICLAWLIAPPADEILVQKQLIQMGLERLQEVLALPIIDISYRKVGKQARKVKTVNVALIKEMRAILEMLQNRVHGSVIQKQQIESKALSVHIGSDRGGGGASDLSLDQIDKMIAKIETALPEPDAETIDGEVEP